MHQLRWLFFSTIFFLGCGSKAGDPLTPTPMGEQYGVVLNPGPIELLISLGEYDYVAPEVTSQHFEPTPPSLRGSESVELYEVSDRLSSTTLLTKMEKEGLRPAGIRHLLAFGEQYRQEQQGQTILCLGSFWDAGQGLVAIPVLIGNDDKRYLSLGWFHGYRSRGQKILAIRVE